MNYIFISFFIIAILSITVLILAYYLFSKSTINKSSTGGSSSGTTGSTGGTNNSVNEIKINNTDNKLLAIKNGDSKNIKEFDKIIDLLKNKKQNKISFSDFQTNYKKSFDKYSIDCFLPDILTELDHPLIFYIINGSNGSSINGCSSSINGSNGSSSSSSSSSSRWTVKNNIFIHHLTADTYFILEPGYFYYIPTKDEYTFYFENNNNKTKIKLLTTKKRK